MLYVVVGYSRLTPRPRSLRVTLTPSRGRPPHLPTKRNAHGYCKPRGWYTMTNEEYVVMRPEVAVREPEVASL
ncbi:hypothetical protein BDN67DRAFT_967854 [Paxillus ammoniavirescens]|nr:hypothetical protein BDN67DRAFT_967854 [Paxillus ammoniavirescens]